MRILPETPQSSIVVDQRWTRTEVNDDFKERHQRRMTAFEKIGNRWTMTETGRELPVVLPVQFA
jgi:predicted aconitase